MTITLEEVLTGYQTLQKLRKQQIPVVAAFYLNKIEDFYKKENANFAEAYKEFVKRYGEKDEEGNIKFDESQNPIFDKNTIKERNKEYYDLITTKIEIPNIKISVSLFDKAEITPEELSPIMPFLTE